MLTKAPPPSVNSNKINTLPKLKTKKNTYKKQNNPLKMINQYDQSS